MYIKGYISAKERRIFKATGYCSSVFTQPIENYNIPCYYKESDIKFNFMGKEYDLFDTDPPELDIVHVLTYTLEEDMGNKMMHISK